MESLRKAGSGLKQYPDLDSAARVRQRASGFSFEIARLLCERSMNCKDGVYTWSTDAGLNWRSPSLLTEEQVLDILAAIKAPVLSIVCSQALEWIGDGLSEQRSVVVSDCSHRSIDGHHHFHMDQPELTAQFILEFLNDAERENA